MRKWQVVRFMLVYAGLLSTTSCSPSDMAIQPQVSPSPGIQILELKFTPTTVPIQALLLITAEAATATTIEQSLVATGSTASETQATTDAPTSNLPTETPSPTAPACTHLATFIKHMSINDYTALKSGSYFTKVWRIQNTGTCTWDTNYLLVFIGGNQMGGPDFVPLPQVAHPGETVDLRLNLIAPLEPQEYSSQWMLQTPDGEIFGIGEAANQALVVLIVVRQPSSSGGYKRNAGGPT